MIYFFCAVCRDFADEYGGDVIGCQFDAYMARAEYMSFTDASAADIVAAPR